MFSKKIGRLKLIRGVKGGRRRGGRGEKEQKEIEVKE